MKRLFLLLILSLSSSCLFAQTKGDKYLAGSIGASLGNQTTKVSDGSFSTSSTQPMVTTIAFQGEVGFFVADNIKLGLALGIPSVSTPTSKDGDNWLKVNTIGFQINPNLSYYARITDGFYYTPEIGGAYEIGKYKEDLTKSETYNANYSGWSIYLSFLSFEYRINENIALGISVGSLSETKAKVKDKDSDVYTESSQTGFKFNEGSISVRYYF